MYRQLLPPTLETLQNFSVHSQFCVPWMDYAFPEANLWHCASNPEGFGSGSGDVSNLGNILTSLMDYAFAIAGILLLFMIIFSGYQLMTSAGNPEAMAKGKSRLTAALIGFVIVFAAFWIYQIIEVLLGGAGNVFVESP